jgi:hypothetical protein
MPPSLSNDAGKLWALIPVVSGKDLLQCMHDPGITGERGEPARFLAQSIPGLTKGIDDGIEILVQPEGEKPLAQIEPDPVHRIEERLT